MYVEINKINMVYNILFVEIDDLVSYEVDA